MSGLVVGGSRLHPPPVMCSRYFKQRLSLLRAHAELFVKSTGSRPGDAGTSNAVTEGSQAQKLLFGLVWGWKEMWWMSLMLDKLFSKAFELRFFLNIF